MSDNPGRRLPARVSGRAAVMVSAVLAILGPLALLPAPAGAQAAALPALGQDISWPQCAVAQGGYAQPMPDTAAGFVVLGLTAGRAFTDNPCLAQQVTWVKARHLHAAAYAFATYPRNTEYRAWGAHGPFTTKTVEGRMMNVGYAQAQASLLTKWVAGLRSPMVWIDIEPRTNRPWSTRTTYNLAVIRGMIAGSNRSGYRTGIYTNASGWKAITGGAQLGLPEWSTVGPRGRATALAACTHRGLQGGPIMLAQYWTSRADYDVICPALTPALMAKYFRDY
jgi:hypothetical protein